MPKQKRTNTTLESLFDRIFAAASQIDSDLPETTTRTQQFKLLRRLKSRILSEAAEEEGKKIAANEFTLEEAVEAFNLTYVMSVSGQHFWNIHDLPETKNFAPTPRIVSLLKNYSRKFDRSSAAGCKTAIDFILNECLTLMKGNSSGAQPTEDKTPKRWDAIKLHCKVSFSHKIISPIGRFSPATVVNGRVDYAIGIVVKSRAKNVPKRRFHSLLLVVEAPLERSALPQLVVYLACLHQSRLRRLRSDASVYGLASDGFVFIFVTISHQGVLKLSRRFDVFQGDLKVVLGCLKYVLEKTANMSRTLTPERSGGWQDGVYETADADADDKFLLSDQDYLHPPEEDFGDDTSDSSTSN